jgi:hypothetical protein
MQTAWDREAKATYKQAGGILHHNYGHVLVLEKFAKFAPP